MQTYNSLPVPNSHKMQTVLSFFQRYIVRDISLTCDISLAHCDPVRST